MKTKLLIYIPTYNRQNLLQKTLESIVVALHGFNTSQVKVHISNNASDDNTLEICKPFLNDQISVDSNASNLGFVGNCVKGLQIDLGQEYTWMVGDDDLITPWSIRMLFTYLQELEQKKIQVKFIHVNLFVVSEDTKNNKDIFNLVKENKISGFRWLMNSKFSQPSVAPFRAIVDPYVDDFILGSIMTLIFDSNLVRETSKHIDYSHLLDGSDWPFKYPSNQAWYPFSFTFFHTFSRDDLCLVIPDIFVIGSLGHQGWTKDRSLVIAAAFDGLFECFNQSILNREELEEYSKKFFIRHKHHLSDLIKNRIELFSEIKREILLKTYAWFVDQQTKK